jgi:hypothetical protein
MKPHYRSVGLRAVLAAAVLTLSPIVPLAWATPPSIQNVEVAADLSTLPPSERAALKSIRRAARRMDELYMRQVWPGTPALVRARAPESGATAHAEIDAFQYFKGPWLPSGEAFVAGAPARRLPGDYYPPDATKPELEKWLGTLDARAKGRALAGFTAIVRNEGGGFRVMPYHERYAETLRAAASDLLDAAALTREPTLARFLRLRAKALLDDDYYESDVAFVRLKGPLDVVLGPYEVDDDEWFGVKTVYEAAIGIVHEPTARRIAGVAARLQELEDNLPLAPALRGRKLAPSASAIVLDAVYMGGQMDAGGPAAGYGLPNDTRVLRDAGSRTGVYRNLIRDRYESAHRPIADAVLAAVERADLRFEDVLDEILFVRLFDSLGPQLVEGSNRPVLEALGERGSVAGQVRSMLLSLWGHRYLMDNGYLEERPPSMLYAAFLVPALGRIRDGLARPASQGSTYVLDCLLEAGAIRLDRSNHFTIDSRRADAEIARAADEFVGEMAKGDFASVSALLDRHIVVRDGVKQALARAPISTVNRRAVWSAN